MYSISIRDSIDENKYSNSLNFKRLYNKFQFGLMTTESRPDFLIILIGKYKNARIIYRDTNDMYL